MSEGEGTYRVTYDVETRNADHALDPVKTSHPSFSGQNTAQGKNEPNLPDIAAAIKNDWQTLKPGEQASLVEKVKWFMQQHGLDRKAFEQMVKTHLMTEFLEEAGYEQAGFEFNVLDVLNKNLGGVFGDKLAKTPLEISIGTGRMNIQPVTPPGGHPPGTQTPPPGYVSKDAAHNDVYLKLRLDF